MLADGVGTIDGTGVDIGSAMLDGRIGVSTTLDKSARVDEDATDGSGVWALLTPFSVVDELGSCGSGKELD